MTAHDEAVRELSDHEKALCDADATVERTVIIQDPEQAILMLDVIGEAYINAYLAAMLARGWKMCPKPPTVEMKEAAEREVEDAPCGTWGCCAEEIAYSAMWDAAPSPRQEKGEGE